MQYGIDLSAALPTTPSAPLSIIKKALALADAINVDALPATTPEARGTVPGAATASPATPHVDSGSSSKAGVKRAITFAEPAATSAVAAALAAAEQQPPQHEHEPHRHEQAAVEQADTKKKARAA